MNRPARDLVRDRYSVEACLAKMRALFRSAAGRTPAGRQRTKSVVAIPAN